MMRNYLQYPFFMKFFKLNRLKIYVILNVINQLIVGVKNIKTVDLLVFLILKC